MDIDEIWSSVREEAEVVSETDDFVRPSMDLLLENSNLIAATAALLAYKLSGDMISADLLAKTFFRIPRLKWMVARDLHAVRTRDPACTSYLHGLVFSKGFHALQAYRIAHSLWIDGRREAALLLQSEISAKLSVDVHPAAELGCGVFFDHATGIVIGETAVVGDNSSLLQHVTLGGTGKFEGDRHPKVGSNVLIGAGATVLGNIRIGTGAKIGAGSVVLDCVPDHRTAVGVPARVVGRPKSAKPSEEMDHTIEEDLRD